MPGYPPNAEGFGTSGASMPFCLFEMKRASCRARYVVPGSSSRRDGSEAAILVGSVAVVPCADSNVLPSLTAGRSAVAPVRKPDVALARWVQWGLLPQKRRILVLRCGSSTARCDEYIVVNANRVLDGIDIAAATVLRCRSRRTLRPRWPPVAPAHRGSHRGPRWSLVALQSLSLRGRTATRWHQ